MGTAAMITANDGAFRPILPLDRATRDALAVWAEQTFPAQGRRKAVARHFDLSLHEARMLIEGQSSAPLIDKLWKHPNGGWRVALPVLGAVIGQTADGFILQERKRLADERDQLAAHEARLASVSADLLALGPLGALRPDRVAARRGREVLQSPRRLGA